MRASPRPRRSTNGTTRASCWRSGWPRPGVRPCMTRTCSARSTCSPAHCWPRSTIRARARHDALKRRCLYHWIEYPDVERVAAIIRRRVPAAAGVLADQVARGVARLRALDLAKPPGVAEAISWAEALGVLGADSLDEASAARTTGAVIKYEEDLQAVRATGFAPVVSDDRG